MCIRDRYKADPDYASCVSLCTKGALHEMVVPALLAIIVPLATGLVLGPTGVVGLLGGVSVTGFAMAVFMSNAGGAWDKMCIRDSICTAQGIPSLRIWTILSLWKEICRRTRPNKSR